MLLYILILGTALAYFLLPKIYRLFTEDSSMKQRKWLDDLNKERTKRDHFYQRGRYLLEEIQPFTEKLEQGKYLSKKQQLELDEMVNELRDCELRVRYHETISYNLEDNKPCGSLIKDRDKFWETHDDDACRKGKDKCADECVGCCARLCGCCTKPRGKDTKGSPMYQHCTFACGCCVRYYGYYPGEGIPMKWAEGKGELRPGLALTPISDTVTLKRNNKGHWKVLDLKNAF